MTERDIPKPTAAHPELVAEPRHILELITQADKLMSVATSQLEEVTRQVSPPHPPPPPPWRERMPDLLRDLDRLAATIANVRSRAVALIDAHPSKPDQRT